MASNSGTATYYSSISSRPTIGTVSFNQIYSSPSYGSSASYVSGQWYFDDELQPEQRKAETLEDWLRTLL